MADLLTPAGIRQLLDEGYVVHCERYEDQVGPGSLVTEDFVIHSFDEATLPDGLVFPQEECVHPSCKPGDVCDTCLLGIDPTGLLWKAIWTFGLRGGR